VYAYGVVAVYLPLDGGSPRRAVGKQGEASVRSVRLWVLAADHDEHVVQADVGVDLVDAPDGELVGTEDFGVVMEVWWSSHDCGANGGRELALGMGKFIQVHPAFYGL